ncbi:MAG: hypothetical protein HY869_02470 [Chloroflexi bacterium]|nr:hypothetical protein [Chloroflexota bacterium]
MPTESSKETRDEGIAIKQNKMGIIIPLITALIGSAVTLLVGVLAFPPFQEWVRDRLSDQKIEPLGIEQMSPRVFAYYGEADNLGGFARLELIFDAGAERPSYELSYNLPGDQHGYTGMAFQFKEGSNLSRYGAVECIVIFSELSDVVDLYFKDIAGNFNTIRVSNNGVGEMRLRYEFTNFPAINFNAVKEFGIVVSTDFSTGSHKVQIKDVRFSE